MLLNLRFKLLLTLGRATAPIDQAAFGVATRLMRSYSFRRA
jgi:hypothetical protein